MRNLSARDTLQRSPHKRKIIFLSGPTASGKSEVAVKLAQKLGAEIISCDSMQIYKGMDIITAKPAQQALRSVPHHLIGEIGPEKEYDVSKYRLSALKALKGIIRKNKVPLFAGGTGFYMSVLLDGIFKQKAQSKKARQQLYRSAEKKGSSYLHKKLKIVDPLSASKIHPNDLKRIVRALEVYQSTGKPISELQKERSGLWNEYDVRIFCLNPERKKLYQMIDQRVDRMFRKGLLNEAKKLLRSKLSRTAATVIGLKTIEEYLSGACSLGQAKESIKRSSRQYAKRQLTWFRKDKRIIWINIKKESPSKIAERINRSINGKITACNS